MRELAPEGTPASYQRKQYALRMGKPGATGPSEADRKAWRLYYQQRRIEAKREQS